LKLHRIDVNRFIKINGLKEVTALNIFDKGMPTSEGIFSYDIFGDSKHERESIPAYIDLKGHYLHPLAYNNLIRVNRKMDHLISGTKYFKLTDDGQIVEDPNGDTGLEFLYSIWDKLKFKDTDSVFVNERIQSLKDKKMCFVDKWIIFPAFYRDVNFKDSRPSYDEINDKYMSIIRKVHTVSQQAQYNVTANNTKAQIQATINEIHDQLIKMHLKEKYGTMKRFVLGKNVTFGSRLIISAPKIRGNNVDDMIVRFNQMGVPLAAMCSLFFPIVKQGLKEFFHAEFVQGGKYGYRDKSGEIKYISLIDPETYFSDDFIEKAIKRFIYSDSGRFETIDVPPNEEGIKLKMRITGRFNKKNTTINRLMTWTDIFYIVCMDKLSDYHVYAVRYPITGSFSINPSKASILTTHKTEHVTIGDKEYKFYPIVEPDVDSETKFIDTLIVGNPYLAGYGGDYDGHSHTLVKNYIA